MTPCDIERRLSGVKGAAQARPSSCPATCVLRPESSTHARVSDRQPAGPVRVLVLGILVTGRERSVNGAGTDQDSDHRVRREGAGARGGVCGVAGGADRGGGGSGRGGG